MFDLDKWQEIWFTIRKHKLRTALTAFGVFWGIFMLIMLLGAGKGLENGSMSMFGTQAKNTMYIWGGKTRISYNGLPPGRQIYFSRADVEATKKQVSEVRFIAPQATLYGSYQVSYKNKFNPFQATGTYPDLLKIRGLEMGYGRFLNERDLKENRKVAVIGNRVQEVLFGTNNPVGEYISVKGVFFKVIGVHQLEASSGSGVSREVPEAVYIPITTFEQTFNQKDKIGLFIVTTSEEISADEAEKKIKTLLSLRHNVDPADEKALGGFNTGKLAAQFTILFGGINLFVWIVGVGTIIAGIVGVSNIMLIIVKERTREIGIRKAMGATPGSIISLVLLESIVITSVSGYIGLVAGVGLLELINNVMQSMGGGGQFFKNPQVDLKIAIYANILLVVTGALAGLYPASKAANINPIEAMRDE